MSLLDSIATRALEAALPHLCGGALTLDMHGRAQRYGTVNTGPLPDGRLPVEAALVVHDPRCIRRLFFGSDIGLGEAYMDGDWSSPDLVALTRLLIRNAALVEERGSVIRGAMRRIGGLARQLRDNTIRGSRQHIHEHYDLGNPFFALFLDTHLMYSCGYHATGTESLEEAQEAKLDKICQALQLGPDDHVLEIGSGWGGFAAWAATRYGCRVTTTTISEEQYRHTLQRVAALGAVGQRIEVLLTDYRELGGTFDKLVSIEMFEAVGLNHYDDYFRAVDRLLRPGGLMLLQTITVDDQWFPRYHGAPDWIEKYIFPGGELASIGEVLQSLARVTSLSVHHAENIGVHYALTLRAWRQRFHARLDEVRAQGFSDRFIRMWDLYLAWCEAAFLERHTGDYQLLLAKNYGGGRRFNEPARL